MMKLARNPIWRRREFLFVPIIMILLLIFGCWVDDNDPDDDGDVNPAQVYLEGVAAGGDPLPKAVIKVRDSAHPPQKAITKTSMDGAFTVEVTGMTPPYLISATGTVNGEKVTYYSTCDSNGRVNITPLTHLAMAMALGQDPVTHFKCKPHAAVPDTQALAIEIKAIMQILAVPLAQEAVAANFDLMRGEFIADGTGFDALLDRISVTMQDNTCTVVDTANGSILLQDTGTMAAVKAFLAFYEKVFEDGILDSSEAESLLAWYSEDMILQGRSFDQIKAAYSSGTYEGAAGIIFDEISFYRMMYRSEDHPLGTLNGISEMGDHNVGFWYGYRIEEQGGGLKKFGSFVLQDGRWKHFGDRVPFAHWNTVVPATTQATYLSEGESKTNLRTGLSLSVLDAGRRGADLDVQTVIIANSALPPIDNPFGSGKIAAVVLTRNDSDPTGEAFSLVTPVWLNGGFYFTDMGDMALDLNDLVDNFEFLHVALNSRNEPVYVWTTRIWQMPYTVQEINQHQGPLFADLDRIDDAAVSTTIPLSQLTLEDGLMLRWKSMDGTGLYPLTAMLSWFEVKQNSGNGGWDFILRQGQSVNNPAFADRGADFGDWVQQPFNPPPSEWTELQLQQQIGRVTVATSNEVGYMFANTIQFNVVAE